MQIQRQKLSISLTVLFLSVGFAQSVLAEEGLVENLPIENLTPYPIHGSVISYDKNNNLIKQDFKAIPHAKTTVPNVKCQKFYTSNKCKIIVKSDKSPYPKETHILSGNPGHEIVVSSPHEDSNEIVVQEKK